jgi:hypothetical protein
MSCSNQFRGIDTGQRLRRSFGSAPKSRWLRLDQRHSSAFFTSPARRAFRSTYRNSEYR